jgi:hypothetical protein
MYASNAITAVAVFTPAELLGGVGIDFLGVNVRLKFGVRPCAMSTFHILRR